MNAKVSSRVTVHATAKHLFTFIDHLEHHQAWNPHLDSLEPAHGKLKQGSHYVSTSGMFGVSVTSQHTVTAYEPPTIIEFDNLTGLLHCISRYELRSNADKTTLICATEVITDNLAFALALPMLRKVIRTELQADVQALKRLAEQKRR